MACSRSSLEMPRMAMADIWDLGILTLLANAFIAFLLNVSVVLLVRAGLDSNATTLLFCASSA